jgi:hypothetical protein
MGSRNCEILLRGKATGRCRVFAPGLPIADIPVLNEELASYRRRSRWRQVLGTRATGESFQVTHSSKHAKGGRERCLYTIICLYCVGRLESRYWCS